MEPEWPAGFDAFGGRKKHQKTLSGWDGSHPINPVVIPCDSEPGVKMGWSAM